MKMIGLFFAIVLLGTGSAAQADEWSEIIGRGQWMYTAPENLVPQSIEGYRLLQPFSRPTTMANWQVEPIFEALQTHVQVRVRCRKDYSGVQLDQPWLEPPIGVGHRIVIPEEEEGAAPKKPLAPPIEIPIIKEDFHGLPAGRQSDILVKYSIFRLGGIVYQLSAVGPTPSHDNSIELREVAEAIYRSQTKSKAPPSQPVPSQPAAVTGREL